MKVEMTADDYCIAALFRLAKVVPGLILTSMNRGRSIRADAINASEDEVIDFTGEPGEVLDWVMRHSERTRLMLKQVEAQAKTIASFAVDDVSPIVSVAPDDQQTKAAS